MNKIYFIMYTLEALIIGMCIYYGFKYYHITTSAPLYAYILVNTYKMIIIYVLTFIIISVIQKIKQ